MVCFMKFASFDIETAAILPGVVNLNEHLEEIGIACAAILKSDCDEAEIFAEEPRFFRESAIALVRRLQELVLEGYIIISWNGLAFVIFLDIFQLRKFVFFD